MANDLQHTVYFELRDALAAEGCALCRLVQRGLSRYFEGLAYERVNDINTRAGIRAAFGFCADHGRMLRDSRAALGSAIIQRDVIKNLAEALEGASARPAGVAATLRQVARGGRRVAALEPREPCPACVRRDAVEQTYVEVLMQRLGDAELLNTLRASSGLCLPHLRLALRRTTTSEAFEQLRGAQLEAWGRIQGQLDEFIRKHDYRFRSEPPGEEANSWAEAIDLVSGQPGLVPPLDDGR